MMKVKHVYKVQLLLQQLVEIKTLIDVIYEPIFCNYQKHLIEKDEKSDFVFDFTDTLYQASMK